VSVLVMPVIGFGLLVQLASSNTVLQTIVDDHMRGRLMSFYSMAFMGMVPLGSLLSGFMARLIGAPATVLLNGLWCMAGSLLFLSRLKTLRRHIRPIYMKMGIIPEDVEGLPTAPGGQPAP
jgi:MFS family permease